MKSIAQSFIMLFVMTFCLGILYPLFITALGQLLWPKKSNGSLIIENGHVVGSELIAQNFTSDKYFFSRPSASNYSAVPSSASNLGPTSKELLNKMNERKLKISLANQVHDLEIPNDLLMTSASGLDPDTSLKAAHLQINRIAKARGLNDEKQKELAQLIKKHTKTPMFGILGEERINVLLLNVDLDSLLKP